MLSNFWDGTRIYSLLPFWTKHVCVSERIVVFSMLFFFFYLFGSIFKETFHNFFILLFDLYFLYAFFFSFYILIRVASRCILFVGCGN
jgi:hypothetical protein